MTAADTEFDDIKARRNAVILASAQALYGATLTAVVVTSGLVGAQLAPSPSWATLPMSMTIVGTALTTFPISLLMRRVGRRVGRREAPDGLPVEHEPRRARPPATTSA